MNKVISNSPFRDKGKIGNILRAFIRYNRLIYLQIYSGFKIKIGIDFSVGKNADIRPANFFNCGNHVGIGKNFTCETDTLIGDYTLISSNVTFISNDHAFDNPKMNIYTQGRLEPKCIILEGDNLIGFGAILIAPCIIKKGAIIGSGAVVKGQVSADSIYAGVPAKKIKARFASFN